MKWLIEIVEVEWEIEVGFKSRELEKGQYWGFNGGGWWHRHTAS